MRSVLVSLLEEAGVVTLTGFGRDYQQVRPELAVLLRQLGKSQLDVHARACQPDSRISTSIKSRALETQLTPPLPFHIGPAT